MNARSLMLCLGVVATSCTLAPLTGDDVFGLDPNGRASLRGLVTDAAGRQPLEGATVQLASRATSTGATGEYLLERLTPGEVEGVASRRGYVPQSFSLTLTAGANALDVELAALPCGGCPSGQVCDPAGQACVAMASLSGGVVSACSGLALSARVTLGGWSTCSTTGKAYFQLTELLPGGPQRLAVGKQGYEPVSMDLTLQPGFNTVADVRLTPAGGCGAVPTEVACSCSTSNCQ